MYNIMSNLLADRKGDIIFSCFGMWHIIYIALIFSVIVFTIHLLKNKSAQTKQKAILYSINTAFSLYIADFFLMPFAYGEIDIEKLPFHICTAMCVMCFLSRHNKFFSKYKTQFAVLGLVSNIIYVIYPAGIGWYAIHPLSYRVVQTLLYHGIMTAYGIFTLTYEKAEFKPKKDLAIIITMVLWALLGNTLYNSDARFYNWSFVVRDPFYILPENIAPFVMPFVIVAIMLFGETIIYKLADKMKKHS